MTEDVKALVERVRDAWLVFGKIAERDTNAWHTMNNAVVALEALCAAPAPCHECGHDLHGPFCPACNPEMGNAASLWEDAPEGFDWHELSARAPAGAYDETWIDCSDLRYLLDRAPAPKASEPGVEERDLKWLLAHLERQKYTGHCGEENSEIRARHDYNERISRIASALAGRPAGEG